MKFVALKDLPQGQKPGDVFDVPEEVGLVLVSFGVADRVDPEPPSKSKHTYKRRDLVAETDRPLGAANE